MVQAYNTQGQQEVPTPQLTRNGKNKPSLKNPEQQGYPNQAKPSKGERHQSIATTRTPQRRSVTSCKTHAPPMMSAIRKTTRMQNRKTPGKSKESSTTASPRSQSSDGREVSSNKKPRGQKPNQDQSRETMNTPEVANRPSTTKRVA